MPRQAPVAEVSGRLEQAIAAQLHEEWPILPPLGYLSGQALMLEGKCGGLFERQIGWSWARLVEVTSE